MRDGVATRLQPLLTRILGEDPPIRVRGWDGSEFGPPDAPRFVIRDRRALRRLLWKPGELGLARAYIAGELDIEGDFVTALAAVQELMRRRAGQIRLSSDDKREIVRTAVTLGAVGPEPRPPTEEATWIRGAAPRPGPATAPEPAAQPRQERPPLDVFAAYADEVGTAFFGCVLGPELTSTSGDWTDAGSLEEAQRNGYERVAGWLGLEPGMCVYDAACGWGSFALHVAARYGVRVVGRTISQEQAQGATDRVARAGLTDRVEIVAGNAEPAMTGPYDAIVALTGTERSVRYISSLHRLLRPGGRLLTRQLNRPGGSGGARRTFTARYMFAGDGRPGPLGAAVSALEEAGFEVRDVRALREDYALTMREWSANLQREWEDCAALASPGRGRVWLLYLAATALACEAGRLGLHEILSVRPGGAGYAPFPSEERVDARA